MSIVLWITLGVLGYLAAGFAVLMLDMRLRPGDHFKEVVKEVPTGEHLPWSGDVYLSPSFLHHMRLKVFDGPSPEAYRTATLDQVPGWMKEAIFTAVREELRSSDRFLIPITRKVTQWGDAHGSADHMFSVIMWPIAVADLISDTIANASRESLNKQTRLRAELEAELAKARREVDALLARD